MWENPAPIYKAVSRYSLWKGIHPLNNLIRYLVSTSFFRDPSIPLGPGLSEVASVEALGRSHGSQQTTEGGTMAYFEGGCERPNGMTFGVEIEIGMIFFRWDKCSTKYNMEDMTWLLIVYFVYSYTYVHKSSSYTLQLHKIHQIYV